MPSVSESRTRHGALSPPRAISFHRAAGWQRPARWPHSTTSVRELVALASGAPFSWDSRSPTATGPRATLGSDWPADVAALLRDRPVRKRYLLAATVHAVNIGRVVGCVEHWFEVLYEDEYRETLGALLHRLLPVLQLHLRKRSAAGSKQPEAASKGWRPTVAPFS